MRIGLVGQAGSERELLREALEFLVADAGVDLVVYLGVDDSITEVTREWASEQVGGDLGEDEFLRRVEELAPAGGASELEHVLSGEATVARLPAIRRIPKPPTRAIEMIGDRIVTLVWDKAVLVEEDIANSFLLVYGKSDEMLFRKFGPRYFFTPGSLSAGKLGVLEEEGDGFALGIYTTAGVPVSREALQGRATTKLTVSS